ncbi:porin [Kushneria avicenniae]|uniref:Porin n=1 Tax=Kushneria avicenniae TaxID=402385 RepID=A0A1I1I7J3_9GAMM|nr:porin [Kushneria avicenniae]SFC32134.1 porin [Kushneria avicenniae]
MKRILPLLAVLLWTGSADIQAQTRFLDDRVTLSGFGTLGLLHSNQEHADFVRDIGQPKGAEQGWSSRIDTRLGLQADIRFDEKLTGVIQGMSQYHSSGDFSPELMLAFLRYSPDPGFQFRVGRLGWDVDLVSDSRYVGYAYPWIRPPVDHFGVLQLTYIDGADVTFKRPMGSDLIWARFFTGRTNSRAYLSDELYANFDADHIYGGHLNYETGAWRFRAGYTRIESDVDYGGTLADQVAQIPGFNTRRFFNAATGFEQLEVYSVGAIYNPGPLQLQAIWNRDILIRNEIWVDSAFVSAAWRFNDLSPYTVLSAVRTHDDRDDPLNSNIEQRTWGVGLRYDVANDLAIKTQVDRIHTHSPGLLWRNTDDSWNGGWSTMVSLGLDFIF